MNTPQNLEAELAAIGDLARLKAELETVVRERDEHRTATLFMLEDLEENRKRIERARQEWVRVFDGVRDPIFVHDREFRIVRCNRAYAERGGMPISEVIGKRYWEVFPKRDGPLPGCYALVKKEEEEEEEVEVRVGGDAIFLSRNFLVHDTAGVFLFAVHIMKDITERKRAETAMQESEDRYRSLAENMSELIYRADPKTFTTIYVNRAAEHFYGYTVAEWLSNPARWEQAIHPEDRERVQRAFTEAQAKVERGAVEYRIVRRDGAVRWVIDRFSWEKNPAGLVVSLSGIISDITERKQAEAACQEYAKKLERSLEETIQAVALTVEMRDPYTAGHQRRVAGLAAAIAAELGLPKEQIRSLQLAGVIHDLGKIHIPAEILSKPGKLTDIEFSFIKTHPQAGYDILKDVEFPWPIAQIVLQHHERLDGSGYPQGLKGEAILLESRIMAVADVVEAMASHRPYRAAVGLEAALAEIECGRGGAYDAVVADACIKLFREERFAFQK